ncbi:FAD-binding domain-containing protein [Mycena venus]|uniref:FAD-binding domain-containing protein n=1 Tax=Mycena venus TaxID=2733690 RepID=A0A8H6XWP2_9AGAR|nr:FAD-binding domain-containing protein [Mycena venus]
MVKLPPTFTLLLFLAVALADSATEATIVSCLHDSGLEVDDPQSPDWQNATTPFNTKFHWIPAAIVYPRQASDVKNAVLCAVEHKVHVSALSGGHSYSASGYGSRDGALVVSFRNMRQISYYSSDNTVLVQPGIHLGDFALALYTKYRRAMAHGICPFVGLGGHVGFGGWGLSSRSWGLLIDQIEGAELVQANGNIIHVSATENPDLFWAIRGASSAYGIVTQYKMRTQKAPDSVIRFAFNFIDPDRSPDKFARVLSAYQDWSLTAPKEIGIVINVWQFGRTLEMTGYYLGNRTDFDPVAKSLLGATGQPNTTYMQERAWILALIEANGGTNLSTEGIPEPHDTFYAKSLTVSTKVPLAHDSFINLAKFFTSASVPNNFSWFIQFELWGGGNSAISSVHGNATAYPHRDHHWVCQFYGRSNGSWPSQGTAFVDGLVNAVTGMQAKDFGAYANYLDPYLAQWQEKYYADNYPHLSKIQQETDPSGVFLKAQNIGAAK